jgi:hypothetical protein
MHKIPFFNRQRILMVVSICFLSISVSCTQIPLTNQNSKDNTLLGILALAVISNLGDCDGGGDLWARNIQTQMSYCVAVDIISTKSNVIVYKQRGLTVNLNLETFATEFNDVTYPKLVSAFGPPSDVDNDGKVKILVLDILDGATANSAYVAGFFDPVNYFRDGTSPPLKSNFAEILYMDGRELVSSLSRDPQAFSATAAHEFQHLIRYPYMNATRALDDIWINEGTSEVASDIAGFGPQKSRLECFRGTETNRCPNGANGISLLEWKSQSTSATILKQYSMAYAYMRYLYDISGSTETARNTFFRKTVQGGNTGIRAGSASQLMSVFRESPGYSSSLLGSDNPEVFFRTFMLFFGQASAATAFSNVVQTTNGSGNTATVDISSAYTAYPLGATLNDLLTSPLPAVTGSLDFSTGSAFVLNSNYNLASSTFTRSQNMGTVKNAGTTRTLLGWGAYSSSSPLTAIKSLKDGEFVSGEDRYKSLITKGKGTGDLPVCGTHFIDEPVHNDESILVAPPSSKNGNTP